MDQRNHSKSLGACYISCYSIKFVLETARGSAAIFDSKVADTEPEAKVPFDRLVVVH